MLPACPEPLSTGVLSLVSPPFGMLTGVPISLVSVRPVAAGGATVSTVTVMVLLAGPVLPAASRTVTLRLCVPSVRLGEKLQAPCASATALPSTVVPSDTITMLLASAVPLNSGVLSLVVPLLAIGTGEPPLSLFSTSPVAATGATVSTLKAMAAEAGPTLPAGSVTVAVRLCAPSPSVGVVKLHCPLLPTIAVPSTVAPSSTVTVLPAAAVPLIAGVASLVVLPAAIVTGELPLLLFSAIAPGATGGVVSMLKFRAADGELTLPAASVTVVVRL